MCEKNTEFVNPDFGRTYNQIAYFTFESDNILDRNSLSNVMVIGIIWGFFPDNIRNRVIGRVSGSI